MPSSRRSVKRNASDTGARSPRNARTSSVTPSRSRKDMYSGNTAREESERVVADAKRRQEESGKNPFRFYLNVGDEKSFIVLDDEPTFLRWEHEEWDDRNKRMNHYGCISATDNCPACDNLENKSYFAMYLTVIDLTPFDTKAGDHVEFSKKLLVVKSNQHKVFYRRFDKSGTLRGVVFDCFRDKKTDARIGGTLDYAEILEEDDLLGYVREYEDRDGKPQTTDIQPYDYLDMFPETTVASLEEIFGSAPAAGSAREATQELEDEYEDDEDTSNPIEHIREGRQDTIKPGGRSRARGRETSDTPSAARRPATRSTSRRRN